MQQGAGDEIGDIYVSGHQARYPGGQLGNSPGDEGLNVGDLTPVIYECVHDHFLAGGLPDHHVGASTYRRFLEAVGAHFLVVLGGYDVADPRRLGAVEQQEIYEWLLEIEDDGFVVDNLYAGGFVVEHVRQSA